MRWMVPGQVCAAACLLYLTPAHVRAAPATQPARLQVADASEATIITSALGVLTTGVAQAVRDGDLTVRARTLVAADDGAQVVELGASWAGLELATPLARVLVGDDGDAATVVVVEHLDTATWRAPAMPLVDEAEALARVEASAIAGSSGAIKAELKVDVAGEAARLVWVIDPPVDPSTGSNPVFWVDARRGTVHVHHDWAADAWLRSFPRNPALGDAQLFEVVTDPGANELVGPTVRALGCVPAGSGDLCEPAVLAQADPVGDFLYPAPDVEIFADNVDPYDPFDEASAYFHADRFLRWLGELGFGGLVCQAQGQPASLVTNVRTSFAGGAWAGYNNARFTGDCAAMVLLGQGEEVDFALDGDIVAHELGHGVVQSLMAGGWLAQPRRRRDAMVHDAAAINEAVADFLSSAHAGDPIVGDYIGQYWSVMKIPGVRINKHSLRCPDALTGQEHVDSEPLAGALWDVWTQLGDDFVPVVLDTVALLPDDASLEQASAVLIEVANLELGGQAAVLVRNKLKARNLLSCRRILPWDLLRGPLHVESEDDWVAPYAPPPLQLEVDIPEDADTLRLRFSALREEDDDGGVDPGILIRQGAPFSFDYDTSQEPPVLVHDADFVRESLEVGEVVLEVIPGEPVYVAFVNGGSATMEVGNLDVQTWWEGHGNATTSAGTDSASSATDSVGAGTDSITDTLDLDPPTKGGCLCRAEDDGRRGFGPGLLLLCLVASTRRRRSPRD